MEELHVEIYRITNCPYIPSLKKLHDILQIVDTGLLQLWARGNPCQIDNLATTVLEALELWPFTVDVLKLMAPISSFRNAVLQQKPMLLENLFTNAIDSKSGFDKYGATCVALLSTPLEFAIPSKFSIFLVQCLERAVQSLSPETIRPVYLLLSAVQSSYLDVLPYDSLSSLQSQMIEVLTNLDSDNQMASLLCLAVLAKLSSRSGSTGKSQPNVQSSPKDEIVPESADRFLPAQKFFSSRRAPKTLDLVVIKAITACSQSCQLRTYEIVEILRLSREIVDAFDNKEKNAWLAGNTRKTKKLCEKILRSGIEAKVQSEALDFFVSLSAGEPLPTEITLNLKKYLLQDVLSAHAIGRCIVQLEDGSICELLESLMAIACDQWLPCRESLTKINNASRLISAFTERIPTSSKLLNAILQSISSNFASDMFRQYASQLQDPLGLGLVHSHSTIEICPLSYGEAQAQLHHNLVVMVLKSALHAPQIGHHIDASVMTLLLEKRFLHSPAQPPVAECVQRRPRNPIMPRISLIEAVSTPRVNPISVNWRDDLIRELGRDVDCRYEGIIRMVGEVCRDLESRCNEIENPLLKEQSRSRDLQARLENSERNKAELALQTRDHQSNLSALESERDCHANQVEAANERLKELGISFDKIHREFDHAKIETEHAARAAIENARQQDLAYLATMTGKDEMLEEQSSKLASTEVHVQALENELNHVRALEFNNAEELKISKTRIGTLNSAISAGERRMEDLQNKLIQLEEKHVGNIAKISDDEVLIQELNSTIVAVNQASDQNKSLISTLNGQLRKAEVETSRLRLQHETYVSAKYAEIKRLEDSDRTSKEEWQKELKVVQGNAAAAREQSAMRISGLHSEIRKLRKELEDRAGEFAEAQELSGRLVSLMGNTKHQRSSHEAGSRTLAYDERDPPLSDARRPDLQAAKSLDFPIFSPPSRARKRIKRAQDPRTPTTRAMKALRPLTTSKEHWRSTVSVGKVPLAELGSMQGPGLSTSKNQKHREHHMRIFQGAGEEVPTENDQIPQAFDSDEDSFGGGDLFTSTHEQQLSALRTETPRLIYDETTTEF